MVFLPNLPRTTSPLFSLGPLTMNHPTTTKTRLAVSKARCKLTVDSLDDRTKSDLTSEPQSVEGLEEGQRDDKDHHDDQPEVLRQEDRVRR